MSEYNDCYYCGGMVKEEKISRKICWERDNFLKFIDKFSSSLPEDYGFKRNQIYERQEPLPNDMKVASKLAVSNQSGSI